MKRTFICSLTLLLTVFSGVYSKPVHLPLDRSQLKPVEAGAGKPLDASKPHSRPPGQHALGFSSNWSGFIAATNLKSPETHSVEVVSGSWVVPKVRPTPDNSFSSIWVGMDGEFSNTVEQIGTEQDFDTVQGPIYFAWYELFPAFPVIITIIFQGQEVLFPVNPGDLMGAEVAYVGNDLFNLTIMNFTFGIYTTIEVKVPGVKRNSAEWIVEAPSSNTGVLPLADFGKVRWTHCTAKIEGDLGSINDDDWKHERLDMIANDGTPKALTSRLKKDGEAFVVTWESEGP